MALNPFRSGFPFFFYFTIRAADCPELAADQGHAKAQLNLGIMYLKGIGVDQDYNKAIAYLQLAADQGHTDAISMLETIMGQ